MSEAEGVAGDFPPVLEPRRRVLALPRGFADLLFGAVTCGGALCVLFIAIALVSVLFEEAWLSIKTFGIPFISSTTWDPEPSHRQFGALAFIWGTVSTSVIAMLIAVPFGVAAAAYLSELAPRWIHKVGSFLIEMLAAIPSVVYGFWALFVFAPWFQKFMTLCGGPNQGGVGIMTAGIILAIMILPYIASVSYDVLRAVPRSQREGSLALGATKWQTIRGVLLPYARPGIIGGCFIALGRAVGETMAVTMLIGNRSDISLYPFSLGNSIASVIANEFAEASYDLYLSSLIYLGLILLLVSVLVNTCARLLISKASARGRSRQFSFAGRAAVPGAEGSTEFQDSAALVRAHRRNRSADRLMRGILGGAFFLTGVPLFLIFGYLLFRGVSALSLDFFLELPVPIGEKGGGMANAMYGSALMVGMATLAAVPIGLLACFFLVEFSNSRLTPTVRFIGELLGGVPSIVVGIFAYHFIVRPFGHFSGYAGAFALAIMMIPVILRAGEEALRLVPSSLKQGSYALGANKFQTAWRVTLPAALPALVTAVFLAVARVAGETAPLLLTASNNQFWPDSPGDFMPSLPVYIFNYAVSPYKEWHRQAWAAALVLMVTVMLLNFGIRMITGKGKRFRTSAD